MIAVDEIVAAKNFEGEEAFVPTLQSTLALRESEIDLRCSAPRRARV
jgi:hypothetical protein